MRLGTVAVSESKEASIGRLLQERTGVIHSCQVLEYSLPTPDRPWLVEVTIEPTFSPRSSTRRKPTRDSSAPSPPSVTSLRGRRRRDERLRVLAGESGHPAEVPERVPGEEPLVDHRRVCVP